MVPYTEEPLRPVDEKLRELITWIAKNAGASSIFLAPSRAWSVDAHATLDEIVRLYALDKDEVTLVVDAVLKELG